VNDRKHFPTEMGGITSPTSASSQRAGTVLSAEAWAVEQRSNPRARSYAKSASYFIFVAKKWLRFHGKLKMPSPPRARFANELDDFVAYMASEQGLSPISIRSHRWKTSKFLE